jgi:hypothetical protein
MGYESIKALRPHYPARVARVWHAARTFLVLPGAPDWHPGWRQEFARPTQRRTQVWFPDAWLASSCRLLAFNHDSRGGQPCQLALNR